MNLKKTVIIACASTAMICSAIALSMWLTKEREMEMKVSNPKQDGLSQEQTKVFGEGENTPLYYDDEEILLLPVRNVAQGLGGTVSWEKESNDVTIGYKGKTLVIEAGTTEAEMHGYNITMTEEPQMINGCLYIEASIISDFFSTDVLWDSARRQISLKSKGNSMPIVASDVYIGKNDTKEYNLEIPVIMGLNDTNFEKGLNKEIRVEIQALADEFMSQEGEGVFQLQFEKGFINSDFVSICWKGTREDQPFFQTLNIDLREQRRITISDVLTEEGMKELKEQGDLTENSLFYITSRNELAIFDASKEGAITVLFPADGALLGKQWKPKYQALFPGII
ncbi:stalk domain-containing protein [Anaerotignum sp.]|uniref:stalk domain-containing protein n=1 Tax=Anaerotignum sp. TaxID=2039241 RepID=UPI0033228815